MDDHPSWEDPKWEGHSHTYPPAGEWPEDPEATVACLECDHPWRVKDLRSDDDAG